MKKYQIIYADPPWGFNFRERKGLSQTAKDRLYDTMKADGLSASADKATVSPSLGPERRGMPASLRKKLKRLKQLREALEFIRGWKPDYNRNEVSPNGEKGKNGEN